MPTFESWLCFLQCLETLLGEELSGLFCGHLEFQNDDTQEAFILQGFRRPRAHHPESCELGRGRGEQARSPAACRRVGGICLLSSQP